ncbi:MAG: prephenate dehydrogenase/arogenate dehydrogenase family protein [Caldilineaceae bacterium]
MAKPRITIIGLGVTGSSLGLGLQREAGDFEIVGHDKNSQAIQAARKANAVHRTDWNLHNACEGADLILLAVPLSELRDLLHHIREDLRSDTLVFAVVNVLQPAIAVAAAELGAETHFVVGHPVLTGIGGPLTIRADLFDEVPFSLAPGLHTDPSAVQLASDFVERIGAKPFFVDAQEHDGLIAATEQLPQLLAAALMHLSISGPGWREARRLAGRHFAKATELDASAAQLFSALQANRDNLLVRIDQLQQELNGWRELLALEPAEDEKHPLLSQLEAIVEERLRWEGQVILKRWDDPVTPSQNEETRGMFRQMFFGNMMGRRPDRDKRS